jgi:plastocyanin
MITPQEAVLIALRNRQDASAGSDKRPAQKGRDLRHHGVPHPGPNTVHIQLNASTGDVTFHPTTIHVGAGRTVTWAYMNGGPFTIHFDGQSPFAGGRASLHSRGEQLVSPPLPQGTAGHRFRYRVMARVAHGDHAGKIGHGEGGVLAVTG